MTVTGREPTAKLERERKERIRRGHPRVIPPGFAYAAREANKAYEARMAREADLLRRGKIYGGPTNG